MSFRTRLTLFFVLIVIVPMLSVALVLFRLIADNETGKADARVAEGQRATIGLYKEFQRRAGTAALQLSGDRRLTAAIRRGDARAARSRGRALLPVVRGERLVIRRGRRVLADIGNPAAIGAVRRDLVGAGGRRVGRLEVSVIAAPTFARLISRVTDLDTAIERGGHPLAATLPAARARHLPDRGRVDLGGTDYRVATFVTPDFGGTPARIAVIANPKQFSNSVRNARLLVGGILLGFLALAFGFALAVSRGLQSQIGRFLEAARRIAGGDFDTRVPTDGNDEFAELGTEFNRMSGELADRVAELRHERARLENAIRRVGDTFASSLDRDAMLDIVVNTAVDGAGATCGRATTRLAGTGDVIALARAGTVDGLDAVLKEAEDRAFFSGEPAEATIDGAGALAVPLRESEGSARVVGVVAAARQDEPFSATERDLFNYLAAQAALSMENVELHELVQRQAVTDELTRLSNRRRFQQVIDGEVERTRRFAQDLGLIMLDIDDFKQVNDTYGHQQGDLVLSEVARVVRETSREIDEPARYGGEEMAVALPQTDLDGAFRLAERMRIAIEELDVPLPNGGGRLKVTASFGVASLPQSAQDKEGLIAAADSALYEAKRAGKNRTLAAPRAVRGQ